MSWRKTRVPSLLRKPSGKLESTIPDTLRKQKKSWRRFGFLLSKKKTLKLTVPDFFFFGRHKMAAINKNKEKLPNILLAGGAGNVSANNSNEMLLRRAVSACMLWENNAYVDGVSVAKNIADLIPKVDAKIVADLAVEARFVQKLRHIPLFICREMARHPEHKKLLADTLEKVIHRADELCEFLALYWNDNDGKKSIPKQVKKGLAKAFVKFNEYELAKYNKKNKGIKLSDVLNLCHAKPKDQESEI